MADPSLEISVVGGAPASPAPAPVAEAAPAPAPAPAPAEAPAAAPEVKAEPAPAPAPAEPTFRPSLMETAKAEGDAAKPAEAPAPAPEAVKRGKPVKAEESKSTELAKVEAPKPEGEAKPVEGEVLPPIEYAEFTLPEGFVPDTDKLKKFTGFLGEYRAPQELGQKLVEFYATETAELVNRLQAHNWQQWNNQQDTWIEQFRSDPEIGRNKELTTLSNCATVIDHFGGTPEQRASIRNTLTITGAGNNPDIIRLFNNVAKAQKEGRPVPANIAPVQPRSKADRRYSNSK